MICEKCGLELLGQTICQECGQDARVSCKSQSAGSVPLIADALESFEDALGHLADVLMRDGIGVDLSVALCVVDDELTRFKEENTTKEKR